MLLTVPCMTVFMIVSGEWRRVWELLRMLAAKPRLIGGVLVSSALLGVQLWLFMWRCSMGAAWTCRWGISCCR